MNEGHLLNSKTIVERALLLMTHAISQLVGRWLPPPSIDTRLTAEGAFEEGAVLTACAESWRELFCRWCDAAEAPEHLLVYRRMRDPDGLAVSRAINCHLEGAVRGGGRIVVIGDQLYPPLLAEIKDPPLALSVIGDPASFLRPCISVVGSRKASAHSIDQSAALGRALATRGIAVVSGGAIGCDIAAHAGVLASSVAPAPAIVVLAGGLERFYPGVNGYVFRALRERGALFVSERLWRMPCRIYDFPSRNRIIAGLSPITAVMQAAHKSGAMITARQALDQGRDVVALTHRSGDVRASGNNELLQDGASAIIDAADWAKEYAEVIGKTASYGGQNGACASTGSPPSVG